jgi:hypothetical protein
MALYRSFAECVSLSERMVEERFDLELVTRFLILHNWPASKLNLTALRDLPKVLDDEIIKAAMSSKAQQLQLKKTFESTFDLIEKSGGQQLFRRWEKSKSDFTGSFLLSAFEIFGFGVGYHVANKQNVRQDLLTAAKEVWTMPKMQAGFATGRSTEARLLEFVPLGRKVTAG